MLTSTGQVFAFGDNYYGELGPTPTLITLPGLEGKVTQIAAGLYHSLVLSSTV